jgi:hypothetical protein
MGTPDFTAHALRGDDGAVNVFLVNKSPTSAVKATVDLGAPASTAAALYLEGPSLGATSGTKLAGAAISPAGAWTPSAIYALAAGRALTVTVPPASAALVHAR